MNTTSLPQTRLFASAQWIEHEHPQRADAEAFVASVYRQRFGANLREFMPHLLAFRSTDGELQAVVGLRCGGRGALFLERYLQARVESRIGDDQGVAIERSQVVEIGNFAAGSPGAARELILALVPLLRDAGLRWVTFVATRQLRNAFARLGLLPRRLDSARAECMGADARDWGSYYSEQPEVLYGDLQTAAPLAAVQGPWSLPLERRMGGCAAVAA